MADFTSHFLAGETLLQSLPKNMQDSLQENRMLFNLGLQGPDILFYHKALGGGSNLSQTGTKLHKTAANKQLGFMQQYALKQDADTREFLFAYLAGYISHYHLDKWLHPYIGFYVKQKLDAGGKKSNAHYHTKLESEIDFAMHKVLTGKSVYRFNLKKHYSANTAVYEPVAKMYSQMMNELYGENFTKQHILDSISDTLALNKLFYSRIPLLYGLACCVVKIAKMSDAFTTHFKRKSKLDVHAQNEWCNINDKEISTLSIVQIFEKANQTASADIQKILTGMQTGKVINIDDILSFENGL